MKRVILYGLGHDYRAHFNHVRLLEETGQIEVLGVSDRSVDRHGKRDGYPLIVPNELTDYPFDYILLMSWSHEADILDDLVSLHGISRDRIAPFRVLAIPDITMDAYDEIRKKRWSILCNNCFGAILSHQFALEHRSPFKNLFLRDFDFVKFMQDPNRYLGKTPVFKKWDTRKGPSDKSEYPVLELDDILIRCNHHSDPDLAIADWCRRAAKLDLNRLLSIFITMSDERERDFFDVQVDYPRLCISSSPNHRPESAYIESSERFDFLDKSNQIAFHSFGPVNTVNLLLGRNDFLR